MYKVDTEIEKKVEIGFSTSINKGGQTIVHCKLLCCEDTIIRIWPTTFLIDNLGNQYKLLHYENIACYPNWSVPKLINQYAHFTLFFEKLDDDVVHFKLEEQIPEKNGFYSNIIYKNESGVYNNVQIFSS